MQLSTMNQSQMMILESFAGARDEQEANDLMDVLRSFYANRLETEMQRLWDNGTLDQKSLGKRSRLVPESHRPLQKCREERPLLPLAHGEAG